MLVIKDLHVAYGRVRVIHGVSLSVEKGQIVSIIGSNGAGKTTLLNTISGVVPRISGSIELNGVQIPGAVHKVVSSGIIQVPEGRKVFSELTVYENLQMGGYLNSNRSEVHRMVEEMYELFPRLKERKSQSGGTLSGGEQQMLAIARGLMSKPKLLLLDEPSLGLAPKIVEMVFDIIKDIRNKGITILLVEQNANKSLAISDYAYAIENGKIAFEGKGQELCSNPKIAEAYLGTRKRNEII